MGETSKLETARITLSELGLASLVEGFPQLSESLGIRGLLGK